MSCEIYREPDTANFVAALVIAGGIVATYLPQYYNLIKTRNSIGLSPTYLLLICVAGISAAANLAMLSIISIPCCSELTAFECANSQVSLLQVGLQALSTLAIPLLCVIYTNTPQNTEYPDVLKAWHNTLAYLAFISLLIATAALTFSQSTILLCAKLLGLLSTVITFVQYIPQLIETYKLKASGALSVLMMCLQTPGGFVWTATLILKPGSHWSSWLPYLSAASLQGLLLVMCIYFDYCCDHKSETEPLLTDGQPTLV